MTQTVQCCISHVVLAGEQVQENPRVAVRCMRHIHRFLTKLTHLRIQLIVFASPNTA